MLMRELRPPRGQTAGISRRLSPVRVAGEFTGGLISPRGGKAAIIMSSSRPSRSGQGLVPVDNSPLTTFQALCYD